MLDAPRHFYVASGSGAAEEGLVAFDRALRAAGLSDFNLVRISSILPARCEREQSVRVEKGSPLLVAYGALSSNQEGETMASAVCAAMPVDESAVGVIMECSGAMSASDAEERVKGMAMQAMEDRGSAVRELVCSSVESLVEKGMTHSVISAVAIW